MNPASNSVNTSPRPLTTVETDFLERIAGNREFAERASINVQQFGLSVCVDCLSAMAKIGPDVARFAIVEAVDSLCD